MSNEATQTQSDAADAAKTPLRGALDRLLALQAIDTRRDKLARARTQLDPGAEHQKRADAARDTANSASAALAQESGSLKDAELEQKGVEDKIKRSEEQMRSGRLTSAKEIANIERDMNQLTRQRAALDDKILGLMESVESNRTRLAALEASAHQADTDASTQKTSYRAALDQNEQESRRLETERKGVAASIGDAALLQRYEALRARPATGGLAVARINDRHCSGCNGQVSIQEEQRVKDAQTVATCDNCGRILA